MIFCEKCFRDKEISAMIASSSANNIGQCPVCNEKDVHLYDTDTDSYLMPYFEDMVAIYSVDKELPSNYPAEKQNKLATDLSERWNVFALSARGKANDILKSICKDTYLLTPELFENNVGISQLYDFSYQLEHSMLGSRQWSEFTDDIKTKNRYHSKLINFSVLKGYAELISLKYPKGTIFYRARISDSNGKSSKEMSAPPLGKSNDGRANAKGITCLYLSSDIDTTLHEIRAGIFDFVTVGTFVLKRDITVVGLKAIGEISPFIDELDKVDYAINKQYLQQIDSDMSRPLRRSDSALDYVPTQYIVDYIRSIQDDNGTNLYDGIEFKSTTNKSGYNLAVFYPEVFDCTETNVYEIIDLGYTIKKVK